MERISSRHTGRQGVQLIQHAEDMYAAYVVGLMAGLGGIYSTLSAVRQEKEKLKQNFTNLKGILKRNPNNFLTAAPMK